MRDYSGSSTNHYVEEFDSAVTAKNRISQERISEVRCSWVPPDMAAYEFLLRVAAKKDPQQYGGGALEELDRRLRASRDIIENKSGLDDSEWAAKLIDEAVKYCNNDVFPVNLLLAEECLEKAYALDPSARTACILGRLCLGDYLCEEHVGDRNISSAVYWLEQAHAEGYSLATRRLAEFYVGDPNPAYRNAKRAQKYVMEYSETCPADDPAALRLLAHSYAQNGHFKDAAKTMEKALAACVDKTGLDSWSDELKSFEKNEVCVIDYYRPEIFSHNIDNDDQLEYKQFKLFAEWVQELD
jgi:tetratricopeptide (TPR) repeat protein